MTNKLYINLPPLENQGFNLVFKKLIQAEGDVTDSEIFRTLSGLRLTSNGNEKVKLSTSKAFLKNWHRYGLITKTRGKIRLGNFIQHSYLLNEENTATLKAKFNLIQQPVNAPQLAQVSVTVNSSNEVINNE